MTSLFRSEHDAGAFHERYLDILKHWPVPSEHLRIATSQGETFIVACGDRAAPPLILLHGALTNAAVWIGDVAAWAKDFRVYAVDVIGEPGLSAPSRPSLDSDAHAVWLDDILQALALPRAAFVGVSLGGWLALDYAIRRSGRVDRLVALCPGGVGRQRPGLLLKVLPLMLLGLRQKAREVALGGRVEMAPEFAQFLDFIHRTFRPRFGKLPVFADVALQRLTMPVLAIVGGKDAFFYTAETKRRLEAIGAAVRMLPDCGHLITGQRDVIHDFLRQVPSARTANTMPSTAKIAAAT